MYQCFKASLSLTLTVILNLIPLINSLFCYSGHLCTCFNLHSTFDILLKVTACKGRQFTLGHSSMTKSQIYVYPPNLDARLTTLFWSDLAFKADRFYNGRMWTSVDVCEVCGNCILPLIMCFAFQLIW